MTELVWGGRTHVGHVRAVNEDEFVAQPPVFLVADGMGGHDRGDIASALVAEVFRSLAVGPAVSPGDVADALRVAHESVRLAGRAQPVGREMGTTAVAAVLVDHSSNPMWLLANVGDSRIYRYAAGELEQLSSDHSFVQELVDRGDITPEEARVHPDRNIVTRAIGIDHDLTPDFLLRVPAAGERLLLCSDGVHGELTDDEIATVLRDAADPHAAVAALVDRVLDGAARDNLTVVVIDTVDAGIGRRSIDDTAEVPVVGPPMSLVPDTIAQPIVEIPD